MHRITPFTPSHFNPSQTASFGSSNNLGEKKPSKASLNKKLLSLTQSELRTLLGVPSHHGIAALLHQLIITLAEIQHANRKTTPSRAASQQTIFVPIHASLVSPVLVPALQSNPIPSGFSQNDFIEFFEVIDTDR